MKHTAHLQSSLVCCNIHKYIGGTFKVHVLIVSEITQIPQNSIKKMAHFEITHSYLKILVT